jgi:hypothetical protein
MRATMFHLVPNGVEFDMTCLAFKARVSKKDWIVKLVIPEQ